MSIKQQQTRTGVVYEVRFRGPDGREVSRRFRTKREAAAWEATQVAAVARGTYLDPAAANRTLKTVADEWLASNPAKRATSISRDVSVLPQAHRSGARASAHRVDHQARGAEARQRVDDADAAAHGRSDVRHAAGRLQLRRGVGLDRSVALSQHQPAEAHRDQAASADA